MIQAMGLKKRLVHTHSRTAVVGISGGLDSTLALLVTAKAFDMAGKDRKDIIAVTMPLLWYDRQNLSECLPDVEEAGSHFERGADRGCGPCAFP